MKPVVDPDLCIGCGLCEDICPEVFQLWDDGLAHVIAENPDPELLADIQDAIASCPVEAISLQE
jgi:ferredoxin